MEPPVKIIYASCNAIDHAQNGRSPCGGLARPRWSHGRRASRSSMPNWRWSGTRRPGVRARARPSRGVQPGAPAWTRCSGWDAAAGFSVVRLEDAGAVRWPVLRRIALVRASHSVRRVAAAARQQWHPLPELDRTMAGGRAGHRRDGYFAWRRPCRHGLSGGGLVAQRNAPQGVQAIGGADALPGLPGAYPVLVNTLPLTDETRDLLRRDTLSPHARRAPTLINMGRGEHLVEEDLLALLDSGHMAARRIDVFREEPCRPATRSGRIRYWRSPLIADISLRRRNGGAAGGQDPRLPARRAVTGMVTRRRVLERPRPPGGSRSSSARCTCPARAATCRPKPDLFDRRRTAPSRRRVEVAVHHTRPAGSLRGRGGRRDRSALSRGPTQAHRRRRWPRATTLVFAVEPGDRQHGPKISSRTMVKSGRAHSKMVWDPM